MTKSMLIKLLLFSVHICYLPFFDIDFDVQSNHNTPSLKDVTPTFLDLIVQQINFKYAN